MDFNLKGKTAIVTGGGSGLGAAICEVLSGRRQCDNKLYSRRSQCVQVCRLSEEKYGTNRIPLYGDITSARI